MEKQSLIDQFTAYAQELWTWAGVNIFQLERLFELALVVGAILVAHFISRWIHSRVMLAFGENSWIQKADSRFLHPLIMGLLSLILIWIAQLSLEPVLGPQYILGIATSLIIAWVVIRTFSGLIANRELARFIAIIAWSVAAFNIVGLLEPMLQVLDDARLPLGETSISVLDIFAGIITFAAMMWFAMRLADFIDARLRKLSGLPPSARVLITKSGRIVLVALAFFIALNSTGVDLTALAVFGGALGVGIGFGLQKVVGNFISGLILVIDRSIKPGDVIQIGETYGTINRMAARYTSVITRDATEYLIPNESMITEHVVNWTHSHKNVRRKIPVQISYESDLKLAMALMVEAANEHARTLKHPEAKCLIKAFGSDGIDLELRLWINDPHNGVSNIASDIMETIWNKFQSQGIEFPYPQRVVHVKYDQDFTRKPPVEQSE